MPFVGDEPMEFEADPASIPQSALDETGYDEHAIEDVWIERTFEAGGQTQDVVVTNWQAEYDKTIDLGKLGVPIDERLRAAVCTALTTPKVSVLDRTFNPVGEMTSEELAEMVQDRYEGMENLERVDEDVVSITGESTTVGEFEAEADLVGEGVSIDLTLHIAEAVESGDDLVVGVGGYPTELRSGERPNIVSLFEAIEHNG
ncbi:hypothetical protein EA472_17425 [Natrarchaeobius oligotrophus]|uniref:Uncharacterized protein n=2 Tax=Natrarchaeobius TaxID=2501796 RepID=A0A3N6NHK2_NATCH|nr:hypothetical protein EA472_17425 [Natrarchaeobius chitinivorans]